MKQNLGDRMKENYELRHRHYLTRRTPVIVRVDGRAFHTFTKDFARPFDRDFIHAMTHAASDLFQGMQGCKLAYIQSDEASFVLTDYDKLSTDGWFNYNQSKIESISASLMTMAFNREMSLIGKTPCTMFDARAFNIPEAEVSNYFLWRAQDWHRNSVTMYAQAYYSHNKLHGKNIHDMHEMLHKKGKNWTEDLAFTVKNGVFLYKDSDDGDFVIDAHVRPKYNDINHIWECVRPEVEE